MYQREVGGRKPRRHFSSLFHALSSRLQVSCSPEPGLITIQKVLSAAAACNVLRLRATLS